MSFTLEKKRHEFLQNQKEKRKQAFDEKRDLVHFFGEEGPELMECDAPNRRRSRKKVPFGYKLMGSEWFTEVPDDFQENWIIKLCPEGIRYLVVANKGITTCYYRNGRISFKFKSKLPGGNNEYAHKFTVLDCIYNKTTNTLFVYDVLAWNSVSLLHAEAHMRFFWIKSKFEENPEMCEINSQKNFNFVVMDYLPAECSIVQDKLFMPFIVNDTKVPFDGILFYHREGHYVFGRSPLVGWLKTFMIPEILHIDVDSSHLCSKPEDYQSIQQYLASKKKRKEEIPDSVIPYMYTFPCKNWQVGQK
ncbi:hypothetical protein Zmor_005103 [Zophobas morio]|uniref:Snurportin-1 n=1 Tax=Zophobas morio TaxID=2755281 RepID=A0AA38ITT4_9CUCU|nr:hypothetical protein Zmor_005103 [Zophobas morio]